SDSRHTAQRVGRAGGRAALRALWRERARDSVPVSRRESACVDGWSLSRNGRGSARARAAGAASSRADELPGRVGRQVGRRRAARGHQQMSSTALNRLLPPTTLAGLANLELVARTAVEGFLTGLHRSPHYGFSQEFKEYRAYVEGDDPRFVDWNVYA